MSTLVKVKINSLPQVVIRTGYVKNSQGIGAFKIKFN